MGAQKEGLQPDGDDGRTVPYPLAIVFIGALVALYGAVYAIDSSLPTPLLISDEADHPASFIAERARDDLRPLVAIGPKVTGHPNNEAKAVAYLKRTVEDIIGGAHPNQRITYDVQVHSGSFFLGYKPHGSVNAYANVQNVIAKVHSGGDGADAVLVNTHFDTVPRSPGGTDDGLNVAVALEVLRKMSRSRRRPAHDVVFLFNGAEEAGLVASHAFLAHRWAGPVRVLVNLEATGAGGREILFQTGPGEPWLLEYYYGVPRPHANAAGEELFQSNVIPSDTDFRVFRDYGGLVGYDFAFTRDGYRYHTAYDGFDNIEFGRFQHTGDNILRLVRNLAEAPELSQPKTEGAARKMVFYDVFGLFLVRYSEATGVVINSVVVVVSLLLLVWACYGASSIGGRKAHRGCIGASALRLVMLMLMVLFGWVLSVGVVALVAVILDACNRTMTWYSVPALNFGLYAAPVVAVLCTTTLLMNRFGPNVASSTSSSDEALIEVHIVRTLWTVVLLVGTAMGLRMSYVVMIPVLFNELAMTVVHALAAFKPRLARTAWPPIHIAATIIPTMITYQYGHEVIALFIPILGRFGSGTNPDLLMAMIVALFAIMIASYYAPLLAFVRGPWCVVMVLASAFLASIVLASTPVGFPYTFSESHPRLQRYSIYHTMRTIRDDRNEIVKEDAGFYFTRADRNTPHSIEGIVASLERAVSLEEDCNLTLACGLPITNSRSIKNLESSIWIPAQRPPFESNIARQWSSRQVSPSRREYTFSVEGSSRIDLYLSVRKGHTLIALDLVDELPESTLEWNGQPTYYLSFRYGRTPAPFAFTFTLETSTDWSGPVADIAVTTKYIDDAETKTEEYREFLGEFPEWAVFMVTGLAQYENVVLM